MNGVSQAKRLVALCIAAFGMVAVINGCTDTMTAKRGALGEFCNGADVECREDMICSNNVCVRQNGSGEACRVVCDTFERCQVGDRDCFSNCAVSLKNWRLQAVESYAGCYEEVADSECSAVREFEDGPQNYCVSEIGQISERVRMCDNFEDLGRQCIRNTPEFSIADYEQQFTQLAGECRLAGKTYSLNAWNGVLKNGCQAGLDQDDCGKLFRCVNEEFDIGRTEQEAKEGEEPFPPFPTSRPSDSDSPSNGPDAGQ